MKKYGLIGFPLGHSFSAKFFAEKFAREGIDARYDNYEMATVDALRGLIASDPELTGLNVTIPHKQAVIPFLDDLTPKARAIGAVNVIRIERDEKGTIRLTGCNSDIIGFTESLRPLLSVDGEQSALCTRLKIMPPTRALVLGTGGASKAIVAGLCSLGIIPTSVSRRPIEGGLTYEDLTPEVMAAHKVIVNCTPVGMHPHTDEAPAIPYGQLTPRHILYDLVYNPLDTRFMQLGREQGAVVKNGLEMLHLQALAAWEMWETKPCQTL